MTKLTHSSWLDREKFRGCPPGKFPFSLSLVSWGYNEAENILTFLDRAKSLMDGIGVEYEHVLVDDGSRDETYALASEYQKGYPQLKLLRNERNLGIGWAGRRAIQSATKEILFWQTVDWSYDLSRLDQYLWLLAEYDVIQGVRSRGVRGRSDNLPKAIISLTNYALVRGLFGLPLLDFQNVTIYPRKLIQSIECESFSSFTNPELLLKSYWKGASFQQVSIPFLARKKGNAKGTRLRDLHASFRQVFYFWFKWIVLGRRLDKLRGSVASLNQQGSFFLASER